MKKQFKLGIIGCGNMATAILKGIADGDFIRTKKVIVSDVNRDKLNEVYDMLEVNISDDNRFVAENSEYLLLAVKPQSFPEIAAELKGICPEKVISIMAGVKKSVIKNSFGVGLIKVARCMPNLPCTAGYGMMGLDVTDFNKNTDDTEFIFNLFGCLGRVLSVSEDKLDAVTGISGSGPAYAFIFIDSLIDAGVKQGLSARKSCQINEKSNFVYGRRVFRQSGSRRLGCGFNVQRSRKAYFGRGAVHNQQPHGAFCGNQRS